jgi:hypothetical protein
VNVLALNRLPTLGTGNPLVTLEVELIIAARDGKLLVAGIEGVDVEDCDVLAIADKDCTEESGCADEAADDGIVEDAVTPSLVVRPAGVVDGEEKLSGVFVRICWVEKTLPRVSTSNCWT